MSTKGSIFPCVASLQFQKQASSLHGVLAERSTTGDHKFKGEFGFAQAKPADVAKNGSFATQTIITVYCRPKSGLTADVLSNVVMQLWTHTSVVVVQSGNVLARAQFFAQAWASVIVDVPLPPPAAVSPPLEIAPPVVAEPPAAEAPPVALLPPVAEAPPVALLPPVAEAPPVALLPPLAEAPPEALLPPVAGAPPVALLPPVAEAPPAALLPPVAEAPPAALLPPVAEAPPVALLPPVAEAPPAVALVPPVVEAPGLPAAVVPPVAEALPPVLPPVAETPPVVVVPPVTAASRSICVSLLLQEQTQKTTPSTGTSDPTLFFNMQSLIVLQLAIHRSDRRLAEHGVRRKRLLLEATWRATRPRR
jgi:hypothetical protein